VIAGARHHHHPAAASPRTIMTTAVPNVHEYERAPAGGVAVVPTTLVGATLMP